MTTTIFEPFDPQFRDNALTLCSELRSSAPIYRSPQGYWVVTRHADVRSIMGDASHFSNAMGGQETMSLGKSIDGTISIADINAEMPVDLEELMRASLIVATDNPKHGELRRVVNRAFSPGRLAQWREHLRQLVADLLENVSPDQSWEVNSTLAVPLPVSTICDILGVDRSRGPEIKHWSDVIINSSSGAQRNTRESMLEMLHMLRDLSALFVPIIAERRVNPGTDVISDLVRAEEQETLTEVDTLMFILALMVAGNETSTSTIGNVVVSLLENPDQLKLLQAQPSLIPNAIEETLRYRSPVQFLVRTPFKETRLHGQLIRPGEIVVMMMASANRDPEQFPDPDRFDIRRDCKGHVAFGVGAHFCIGAQLARAEVATAIAALLPDLHRWRLSEKPLERLPANLVYGYQRIELVPR
jgi:cytochrome P450